MTRRLGRTAVLIVAVLSAFACRSGERGASDSASLATGRDTAARPAPVPGRFTLEDFRHLRWLEGSWRGALPEGGHFFETYRLADDSTIAMQGFPDSTFRTPTDSARITLRGGTVADEGATSRWVATRLDSLAVHFAPERGGSNDFMWERGSADRWLATLHSRDRQGAARTVMYPMQRVGRPAPASGAVADQPARRRP